MNRTLCLLAGVLLAALSSSTASAQDAAAAKPIKALLVTGGCCHDYEAQKKIITEGVSARANVEWTIVHEGGTDRKHKVSIYSDPNWAKNYDIVVHNECFGAVEDNAFIEAIALPHQNGVPAVMLHCSTHSYRRATTDEWRKAIGITSMSHDKRRDMEIKNVKPEHPVMKGFPEKWSNPDDELYRNEKVWPETVPLGTSFSVESQKDHVVIWVNTYGKGRVFNTTLGHQNATMSNPVYLDLVTRGLLWACDRLNEDGTPKPGFGPAKSPTPSAQ